MSNRRRARDSTIYVGNQKPVLTYVTACMQSIKDCGEVVIKGRGRAIGKAVDVAEVLRNRFLDVTITDIEIGTDDLDGKRLSTISIGLRP